MIHGANSLRIPRRFAETEPQGKEVALQYTIVHYITLHAVLLFIIGAALSKVLFNMTLCQLEVIKNRISFDFPEDGNSNFFETSANRRILKSVSTAL
jgi:hypothetical protein